MSYVNTIKPAYYNEFDENAAQWLRNLIKAGHIAPGEVDERSIEEVTAADLRGFTQCHFFAGIGVWSYALRLAGVPDDYPLWTGSCPCQPFSAAGKGDGFADERHLWPAWHHLIAQCRPPEVLGEQVASKDADPWIDLVQDDLEAVGYAVGAVPFPSAGVGAPHIRDRLYYGAFRVADANHAGLEGWREPGRERTPERLAGPRGLVGGLAHADGWSAGAEGVQRRREHGLQPEDGGRRELADTGSRIPDTARGGRHEGRGPDREHGARDGSADHGVAGGMADASLSGRREERPHDGGSPVGDRQEGVAAGPVHGGADNRLADADGERLAEQHVRVRPEDHGREAADVPEAGRRGHLVLVGGERADGGDVGALRAAAHPGPVNGFWGPADWLLCRDGRWRPVEPGSFPLAHGAAGRVVRLRAYGNAINARAAEAFIRSYFEARAAGSAGLVDARDLKRAA